jgi:hypothetical protein
VKFRKKPVVVDAEQFFSARLAELSSEFAAAIHWDAGTPPHPFIPTLEGSSYNLSEGDWIVKGVKGEFYPCKPDIFSMTYDPTE